MVNVYFFSQKLWRRTKKDIIIIMKKMFQWVVFLIKTFKMSFKFKEFVSITIILFVITVILVFFVRYKHEILMVKYAKPNQKFGLFVITVSSL